MTKPKTTHTSTPTKNVPLNRSRYTGFYLTLLILSTVGTTFSLFNLVGVVDTINLFSISPAFVIFNLVTTLIVLPLSIWALVLLWLKRPLGIWLKLGSYVLSIISYTGLLITASPMIRHFTDQALVEIAKSNQPASASLVEAITTIGIYSGLAVSILISIVFGLLWYFAWKKQTEVDSE